MTLLSNVKFYVEDFFKFCGLLRVSELYLSPFIFDIFKDESISFFERMTGFNSYVILKESWGI